MEPFEVPIHVTQPYLPPLEEFSEGLKEIWETRWLTNDGPVLQRFERSLCRYFGTPNLVLFTNGTQALQIGLQAMDIAGEVITTPFTFVATTHVLHWNKIRPVFVDIEPDYYNLDPARIEAAITPWTTAILAVHVYGHPCNLNALAGIAARHNLKLIYDAAHAFGVQVDGKPISTYGEMSMFSFHATKPFHSMEGGMLVFQDPALKSRLNYLRNFGFQSEFEVVMPGTNAKMTEMQALMGDMVLPHVSSIIDTRRAIDALYRERLESVPGIRLPPGLPDNVVYNHSFLPIEVDPAEFGCNRDELCEALNGYNVFPRRYFAPLVCDFACYRSIPLRDPLTVARRVADRILTLPIYSRLPLEDVGRICDMIGSISRR